MTDGTVVLDEHGLKTRSRHIPLPSFGKPYDALMELRLINPHSLIKLSGSEARS